MRFIITSFILVLSAQVLCGQHQTVLIGTFSNRSPEPLILYRSLLDPRYAPQEIWADPDGHFMFVLEYDAVEEYSLAFSSEVANGAWRPLSFYPDADTVYFRLNEGHDKHLISGSTLTDLKSAYEQELIDRFMPDFEKIKAGMRRASAREDEDSVNYFRQRGDQLGQSFRIEQAKRAQNEPNLVNYTYMLEFLKNGDQLPEEVSTEVIYAVRILQQKYPDHPYTSLSKDLLLAMEEVKPGGRYIDFAAPDKSGVVASLSEELKKADLTLLDLWAPWCGPCIQKSRKIKEQYTLLQEQGFQVVSVMGGLQDEADYLENLNRHPYPWPVLKEINNEYQIWFKYNIQGAGGLQVLLNRDGTILALNPSLEEIRGFVAGK